MCSAAPPHNQKPRKPSRSRRYHLEDDAESVFDYELPDWLVGAH